MPAITSDFPAHGGDDVQYAIDLDAHGVVTITFSTAAGTAWLVPALPNFTWGQVGDLHTLPLGEACFLITAVTRAPATHSFWIKPL